MENNISNSVSNSSPICDGELLPSPEQKHLRRRLEKTIERGLRQHLEAAQALRTIRDERLYRDTHATFEEYCRERWGFSRQHGQRLCDLAAVAEDVTPLGVVPQIESHARPLSGLTAEQRRRAWQCVLELKPDQRTAARIKQIARRVRFSPVDGPVVAGVPVAYTSDARPPVRWYGSKARMADEIVAMFPPHRLYVEPFGGSAAVLLAKPPSDVEIYADLFHEVATFMKTLRQRGDELCSVLKLTPYSRAEYEDCKAAPNEGDEIEVARRFFVRSRQSFSGRIDDSWSYSFQRNPAEVFKNAVDDLHLSAERLRNVQIESRCFRQTLASVPDQEDVLIYCDPPYVRSSRTRHGAAYEHEMTDADHIDLISILIKFKNAKVAISGYDSEVYNSRLSGWTRFEFRTRLNATPDDRGEWTAADRTEVLWTTWGGHES